ncbi:MAG: O-antigen ligase family protein [Candidatus Moranbacteria bacterium]|nr:O-antigen ligase family protein [Candidatus Moranbacteria bacterium]
MITEYFLLIMILSLPLQFALNIGDGFDLVTTRVLVPLLFLFWLARGLARKKIEIPDKVEPWLVAVFLFLSALSLFLGRDASAGFRKLVYFLSIFPIFFVAADVFQGKRWKEYGAQAVAAGGLLAAVVALFQFALPFFLGIGKVVKIWENMAPVFLGQSFGKLVAGNSSWLVNVRGETIMRAFGFFPDPHNFAFFINLSFFTALGCFFVAKEKSQKIFLAISAALALLASILSFSRGGYLGLIAGGFFFAAVYLKRANLLGKAMLAVFIFIVGITVFNSQTVVKRLASSFNLREGSNAERIENWNQAMDMVRDYPLSGVGLGNYARTIDPESGTRSSIYAHNLFLDIAAETGILNAIVFFGLLLFSVWRGVKSGNMLGLGIAAGLAGFLIHSVFDTALYSPQALALLLVVIALGLSPLNLKTKIENGKTTA